MDIISALWLGIIQGLTEFLPVSSTAHLIIFSKLLNIKSVPIAFDVLLHLATVIAVIIYFFKDILQILTQKKKMIPLIIIASIPACVIGFYFNKTIELLFKASYWVGIFLICNSIILYLSTLFPNGKKQLNNMTTKDALFIGIFQSLAIIPGISRSGITVTAAFAKGIEKNSAAKFSFLLSIPVILGATFMKITDISALEWTSALAGFISAFITALLAIKTFMILIKSKGFKFFALYCLIAGILFILILSIY